MEGVQHNTYDVEFYGPNPQCGIYYLGALRAGGGDGDARSVTAAQPPSTRALFESGRDVDRREPVQRRVLHPAGPAASRKHEIAKALLSDDGLGRHGAARVPGGRGLPGRSARSASTSPRSPASARCVDPAHTAHGARVDLPVQLQARPGEHDERAAHVRAQRRGGAGGLRLRKGPAAPHAVPVLRRGVDRHRVHCRPRTMHLRGHGRARASSASETCARATTASGGTHGTRRSAATITRARWRRGRGCSRFSGFRYDGRAARCIGSAAAARRRTSAASGPPGRAGARLHSEQRASPLRIQVLSGSLPCGILVMPGAAAAADVRGAAR